MRIVPPQRASRSYTQQLDAPPSEVFPLLCPVRECDWVAGWDPDLVITTSGVAELECVFTTGPAQERSVWIVTHFDPPRRIDFVKLTPGQTVAHITITLLAAGERRTKAVVTYSYTALSARGEEAVAAFTDEYYTRFMKEWEDQLNHFLKTGTKRSPLS